MLKLLGGDTCTLGSGLRWFPGLETDNKCWKISKYVSKTYNFKKWGEKNSKKMK